MINTKDTNLGQEDVIPASKKLVGHINFDGNLEAITKTKIAVS